MLDAAFKHDWKEANERAINLPTCDPEAFGIYVHLLYHGYIYIMDPDDIFDDEDERWNGAYILADYLQNSDFKDALIDSAKAYLRETKRVWFTLTETIYVNSTTRSAHRGFTITATQLGLESDEYVKLKYETECCELANDLVSNWPPWHKNIKKLRAGNQWDHWHAWKWHEHKGGCYQQKRVQNRRYGIYP